MRFLLACLLLIGAAADNASGQGIATRDRRIADTIKAVLQRSGIKKEQIDTFKIIRVTQISGREQIAAEVVTAQNNVMLAGNLLRNDTSAIKLAGVSISADSNALLTLDGSKKAAAEKELKEDRANLTKAYATLRADQKNLQNQEQHLKDLRAQQAHTDGAKKEDYEVLIHIVLMGPQGRINTNLLVYLDKKYKMVAMKEVAQ